MWAAFFLHSSAQQSTLPFTTQACSTKCVCAQLQVKAQLCAHHRHGQSVRKLTTNRLGKNLHIFASTPSLWQPVTLKCLQRRHANKFRKIYFKMLNSFVRNKRAMIEHNKNLTNWRGGWRRNTREGNWRWRGDTAVHHRRRRRRRRRNVRYVRRRWNAGGWKVGNIPVGNFDRRRRCVIGGVDDRGKWGRDAVLAGDVHGRGWRRAGRLIRGRRNFVHRRRGYVIWFQRPLVMGRRRSGAEKVTNRVEKKTNLIEKRNERRSCAKSIKASKRETTEKWVHFTKRSQTH